MTGRTCYEIVLCLLTAGLYLLRVSVQVSLPDPLLELHPPPPGPGLPDSPHSAVPDWLEQTQPVVHAVVATTVKVRTEEVELQQRLVHSDGPLRVSRLEPDQSTRLDDVEDAVLELQHSSCLLPVG